ncbi:MAG: DUF2794 domain-containing protein [Rubellimicrobium sp.]|nr:DUF2794 domain-containing protein [Rubellimicrobium sp.]
MAPVPPIPFPRSSPEVTAFHRTELAPILGIYGRMVAAGEWGDYAITTLPGLAVFAIFRRSAESPLFRVEKRPALRLRQGQYAVVGAEGQVLRRGNDLPQVLRVLETRRLRAVD